MENGKKAKLLVAHYPLGHRLSCMVVPLLLIAEENERFFVEHCRPECDGNGIIVNKDGFMECFRAHHPGLAREIEQMGPAVDLWIFPEPLGFFNICSL